MKCYFVYLLSHLNIIKLGGKRDNLTGKGKASPCLLSFYAGETAEYRHDVFREGRQKF